MIQTILGPIPASTLGHCQVHEHVFVEKTPASETNPDLRFDDAALSEQELLSYKAAGGVSLCDAQPVGAGRNAKALLALAEATGVNIVASTGYHLKNFHAGDYEGRWQDFYDLYCSEMRQGLLTPDGERLTATAGLVKAAIPAEGAVGIYQERLCAAAKAAADCGRALMLHTEAGQNAEGAVALCEKAGLAPERILLCHADRNAADLAMHLRLAKLGVYLEYDTIARPKYHDEADELRLLKCLLEAGYEERILLSLDTTRARLRAYGGVIGLNHLLTRYLPWLQEQGIDQNTIHTITHANPARALRLRP